ncbi:MAG: GNAT family N-acetyltransferase [Bernardetiaceae bacterium]
MLTFETCTGDALLPYLDELARLRIAVFADFPYLYAGDWAYERDYLSTYLDKPKAVVVLAKAGARVVGASTGLPLVEETTNICKPWTDAGYDLSKIFYLAESVLEKPYRGLGAGFHFMREREAWARREGFLHLVFCAVVRPSDHPLRPVGYRGLDVFWERLGFTKRPDLVCQMCWPDVGTRLESEKSLVFWEKKIP